MAWRSRRLGWRRPTAKRRGSWPLSRLRAGARGPGRGLVGPRAGRRSVRGGALAGHDAGVKKPGGAARAR
eukprot:11187879-Lingulodinium_polyedra.AAC.1